MKKPIDTTTKAETGKSTKSRQSPDGITPRGEAFRARIAIQGQRISRTFPTQKAAKEWLACMKADAVRGEYRDQTLARELTLADLLTRYLEQKTPQKRGAVTEAQHIKIILQHEICGIPMASLSSADIARFRDDMMNLRGHPYAGATIARRMTIIKAAINVAMAEWAINLHKNPVYGVALPPDADVRRDRTLEGDEEQRILAKLLEGDIRLRDRYEYTIRIHHLIDSGIMRWRLANLNLDDLRKLSPELHVETPPHLMPITWAATRLAIETSLRQGEICALKWDDFDADRAVMRVKGRNLTNDELDRYLSKLRARLQNKKGMTQDRLLKELEKFRFRKNGLVGWVPLSPRAVAVLNEMRDWPKSPDGRIFPGSQNAMKVRYARAVADADVYDLTFHDLRHEATGRLAKVLQNPMDLRLVTGHNDLRSLLRYYNPKPEEVAAAMAAKFRSSEITDE